jgi:uncharacterized membrane protein YeaQ/YmgE (transglycosylase-associated protein family)
VASYVASLLVVVGGCAAGVFMSNVKTAVDWIVSGLWVGYAAANILKWHWWRLNGFGYFWGMIVGIVGADLMVAYAPLKDWLARPTIWLISLFTDTQSANFNGELIAFPALFLISLLATVAGSLLTAPESEEVLVNFYRRTRPWGWWGPIRTAAMREDPSFQPNRDFGWDVFNVLVGIIWQTSFVALPIYVVIHYWNEAAICLAIIAVTSAILKRTWYNRLEVN